MSYEWVNEPKLTTLSARGDNSVLHFSTPIESAEVYLQSGEIKKVIHRHQGLETVIQQSDAHHIVVGSGNSERDVYHFLKPNGPAPELRLGLTTHRGLGTWSSLPHDFELNLEQGFEEVFFYLISGGSGRAIQVGQGVWEDNTPVAATWFVHDHTFGTIPMGYHPIVGEPGVSVSYVWAYLCKKPAWEKI